MSSDGGASPQLAFRHVAYGPASLIGGGVLRDPGGSRTWFMFGFRGLFRGEYIRLSFHSGGEWSWSSQTDGTLIMVGDALKTRRVVIV